VIYNFQGGNDANPQAGLMVDESGTIYGTTSPCCISTIPPGEVFKLTPPSTQNGPWIQTVLYTFQGGSDGGAAQSSLILDAAGSLYGTTWDGGNSSTGFGTVFKLAPPSSQNGEWTKTIIYGFGAAGDTDGSGPEHGPVLLDQVGALYGTTLSGGNLIGQPPCNGYGCGTVYTLTPAARAGAKPCCTGSTPASTGVSLLPAWFRMPTADFTVPPKAASSLSTVRFNPSATGRCSCWIRGPSRPSRS
jgi:uncharacterized repeat protein (TIGR03803 family)